MLFGLLTFLVAIIISSVAIYYSVAGLVAIFVRGGCADYNNGYCPRSR